MSWLIKFFQVSLCLIQLRNVIHLQWQKTNRKKMLTRNVRSSYNFATSGSIIHFTTIVAVLTVAAKIRFIWKPHARLSFSSMAAIMKGSCRRIAALWIDFYLLSNSLNCQHRGPKRFVRWKNIPTQSSAGQIIENIFCNRLVKALKSVFWLRCGIDFSKPTRP